MRAMLKHEAAGKSSWMTAAAVSFLALGVTACGNGRETAGQQNLDAGHSGGARIVWCPGPPYRWTNCPPASAGTDDPLNRHPGDADTHS